MVEGAESKSGVYAVDVNTKTDKDDNKSEGKLGDKRPTFPKNDGSERDRAETYLLVLEDKRDSSKLKVRFMTSPGGEYNGKSRYLSVGDFRHITDVAVGWEVDPAIIGREDYALLVRNKDKDARVFAYYPSLLEAISK